MNEDPGVSDTRRLSRAALSGGAPTGWFEPLYAEAADGAAIVPWDRVNPNAMLVAWAGGAGPGGTALRGAGRRAAVVGCGYGRDAEYLATLGFDVLGFDIAPTAIEGARQRHGTSSVIYEVGDLLALPGDWTGAFDFVLESHNVQALPDPPRPDAIAGVRSLVAPGGTLVVLAAARPDGSPVPDGPPWPLLRSEIDSFAGDGLCELEVIAETDENEIMRWRAIFERS